ncbi:hypothetical protein [Clostridium sp.]|uniref:hypothetical protein n=1 Tax=Clostridium sp. TaxID=1506 RepID=UPI00260268DB|nr:hypothetical protein [Clostridium sp.]
MNKINRKIGLGIISMLLLTLGTLFGVSFGGKPAYGDLILNFIGLKPWSGNNTGLHYTAIIALIFLIPGVGLGYVFLKETLELENINNRRRIETWECKLSILIILISSFILPGEIIQSGNSRVEYAFGFPLKYWFIYQEKVASFHLFNNLFDGNKGININIVILFINIVILYYILLIIKIMWSKLYSTIKNGKK